MAIQSVQSDFFGFFYEHDPVEQLMVTIPAVALVAIAGFAALIGVKRSIEAFSKRRTETQTSDATPLSTSASQEAEQPSMENIEQIPQERKAYILAAIAENAAERTGFIIPERRTCNILFEERSSDGCSTFRKREIPIICVDDQQIRKKHPMRYLKSPFITRHGIFEGISDEARLNRDRLICGLDGWTSYLSDFNKALQAVAVTEKGRHVIMQLAHQSCVPTCVAMLVLDHGLDHGRAFYLVEYGSISNDDAAIRWIKQAGLRPYVTNFPQFNGNQNRKNQVKDELIRCLEKRGSGMISIYDRSVGCHEIVLDEISMQDNTATIRDPLHGWAITIDLDYFLSLVLNDGTSFNFIQIDV